MGDRGPIDIENLTIDNFKCFTNLTTWSNNFLYLIILLLCFQVSNSILLDYIAGDPTNYPLTKFAFGLDWKTLHQFSEMDGGARIIFNLNQNQDQNIKSIHWIMLEYLYILNFDCELLRRSDHKYKTQQDLCKIRLHTRISNNISSYNFHLMLFQFSTLFCEKIMIG